MSFSADRQAAQRLALQPFGAGGLARAVEIERDEGADLGLALGDGVGAKFDRQRGRQFAAFEAAGEVERGQHQAVPSIRLTTRMVKRRAAGITK